MADPSSNPSSAREGEVLLDAPESLHGGLGPVLRRWRGRHGWTLAQLAERCGLAKSYLSMIENGRLTNPPSASAVAALASAVGDEAGELASAASWAATPPAVRRKIQELEGQLATTQALGRWLTDQAEAGVDLDTLWRSGRLGRAMREGKSEGGSLKAEGRGEGEADTRAAAFGSGGLKKKAEAALLGATLSGAGAKVPVVNRVMAGAPGGFTDLDYPAGVAEDYVKLPGLSDPDAFACVVEGDSMWPDWRAGDLVVFSPAVDVVDGCDAFARLEPEHESTFKRVFFEDGGKIRLQPVNPKYRARVLAREQVAGLFKAVRRVSVV